MQSVSKDVIFTLTRHCKFSQAKKPPNAFPQREVKIQAEHYEEELLGGITPGGS